MTTKKETSTPAEVSTTTPKIIEQQNTVVNFDPEQDIKQGQKAAKALMKVVEITKPLKLNGKTYLYFEHWQTMAKFFRMTVGTEWVKPTTNGFEAKAVIYQNGVIIGGAEASCNKDEPNWKSKPEFQLKSMAQTRAMSKALRSVLGYIPVLAGIEATPAEEMSNEANGYVEGLKSPNIASNDEWEGAPKAIRPASAKQIGFIKGLLAQKGLDREKPEIKTKLEKLTSAEASAWIDKLNTMEDSVPTIEIEQVVDEEIK